MSTADVLIWLDKVEQVVKGDFIAGHLDRDAVIHRVADLHTERSGLLGTRSCVCGWCAEVRAERTA